jgi:UDP:flavonoid glycosyltransferase YjiC (YdhE family)
MVRTFDRLGLAPVNAARAALGLPPLAHVWDQVVRCERVLVLTTQSFDFAARGELPVNVVYTGPELDDPSWTQSFRSPWPAGATQPLVVVGLGTTFQDQHDVIQRVIDAIGGLPVRGRAIFPDARVAVAHGGHGTTMKAIAYGVPVLSVPLGRDQADNAARTVEAGAGLRLAPKARVHELRRALARLLDEPMFTASARRLAAEIARDVSADRSIHELEALAARRART